MKWFKHLSDAAQDEMLQDLKDRYGFEGIGRWWTIVEAVAAQMKKGSNKCDLELSVRKWCEMLGGRAKVIVPLLYFLADHKTSTITMEIYDEKTVLKPFQNRFKTVLNEIQSNFKIVLKIPKLLELRDRRYAKVSPGCHRSDTIEVEVEVEKENKKKKTPKKKPKNPPTALKDNPEIVDMYELTEEVPEKWRKWAIKKGVKVDVRPIFENFCRNHLKRESQWVDWYRTWQTWIDNAKEINPEYFVRKASPSNKIMYLYDEFAKQELWREGQDLEIEYKLLVTKLRGIDNNHQPFSISELREQYARP
jgi:hypothetical protein